MKAIKFQSKILRQLTFTYNLVRNEEVIPSLYRQAVAKR